MEGMRDKERGEKTERENMGEVREGETGGGERQGRFIYSHPHSLLSNAACRYMTQYAIYVEEQGEYVIRAVEWL